jgi:phosphoglycerol transferase MdoB-like AlkP superfamily enzyme
MNTFDKIKRFCRPFRIVIGVVLIAIGVLTSNAWFYLGVIPLIAGLVNFCPLCIVSKKCSL